MHTTPRAEVRARSKKEGQRDINVREEGGIKKRTKKKEKRKPH